MNALEQLLQDDLNRLVDHLATMTREGAVTECLAAPAGLSSRLEEVETRLSDARLSLLRGYTAWKQALQECSDLWSLANLSAEPTIASERQAA
ncbi:MAG: hypothetical protein C5B48_07965 [Candidatus Rokuibacteriota bacterium]|nr:MAG: hypothetical protein C5B48_07965 [Candidatus Rokubacteria bacterium]